MELSALRLRYHVTNAVVVIAVLALVQYWRSAIDPSFLALVAGLYLLIALVSTSSARSSRSPKRDALSPAR